ncbi:MAG TPA: tetratricopeptide repeat protein [Thermoanaerobaculia bacterium]|nr:tetratricopeptide repeat protein [Thermoanaerobaculia bacterium]
MRPLSYSPSHVEASILEELVVGGERLKLVDDLVALIQDEITRERHRHQLLIGPRGSGKTHVLSVVANRVRQSPELAASVLPIALAEEEVASHPADLLYKILLAVESELHNTPALHGSSFDNARQEIEATLETVRLQPDDRRALETAAAGLDAISRSLGRLVVPIVENLDTLLYSGPGLSRQSGLDEQRILRRVLFESRGMLLIASAPSHFAEVSDPRAPFAKFFELRTLGELSPREMLDLIRARLNVEMKAPGDDPTRHARLMTLATGFERRKAKLRGLLALTGGVPRFAHLFFDLLVESDIGTVVGAVARFLDAQTPYFQVRLDPRVVPEAELEILDLVASATGPLAPSEIVGKLRSVSPNAVSMYLKRLRDRGLVRQLGSSRKTVRYDVSEPLFRLWRRFRLGRTEREQIALLAEFVAAIFEPAELVADIQSLASKQELSLRRRVLESAMERVAEVLSEERLRNPKIHQLLERADRVYLTGTLANAFELYQKLIIELRREGDEILLARQLGRFAHVALLADRLPVAKRAMVEAERLAREVDDTLALANAIRAGAELAFRAGDTVGALAAYEKAGELYREIGDFLGSAYSLRGRGQVLLRLGNPQEALPLFNEARELYTRNHFEIGRANAIRCIGEALLRLESYADALAAFEESGAICEKEHEILGKANSMTGRAEVLSRMGRDAKALETFHAAGEIYRNVGSKLGRAYTLSSTAEILFRLNRPQDARVSFVEAEALYVEAGSDFGRAICQYGYGLLAWQATLSAEALEHLVAAYLTARMSDLAFSRKVVRAIWAWLDQLVSLAATAEFGALLRLIAPLVGYADRDEAIRGGLAHFSVHFMATAGAQPLLDLLPVIDESLPASTRDLLRPARLAAEVVVGARDRSLADESEEVRRAVSEVLIQVGAG